MDSVFTYSLYGVAAVLLDLGIRKKPKRVPQSRGIHLGFCSFPVLYPLFMSLISISSL